MGAFFMTTQAAPITYLPCNNKLLMIGLVSAPTLLPALRAQEMLF